VVDSFVSFKSFSSVFNSYVLMCISFTRPEEHVWPVLVYNVK